MGFLKKITRPISRVLDKVIPNEIKPALPFLAAAAPFMAPGLMSLGGNTMLSRALISGGLNLGSQLAQEGSEGDFDALSLAMASGIGALSAPGTQPTTVRGDLRVPSSIGPGNAVAGSIDPGIATETIGTTTLPGFGAERVVSAGTPSAGDYLRGLSDSGGIGDKGLEFLAKGSDKLIGLQEGLAADGIFSKAGAKALSIPFTQGTMDLAVAENRRFNKQQIIDDALSALEEGADSAARASAIRLAMQQYGFTEDEITETISSAGYRAGGRVGLSMGGDPDFSGIKGAVKSVDENMRADRAGDFFRLRDEAIQKGDSDKIKEIESDFFREFGMVMPKMAKDGGRIGFRDGSSTGSFGLDRYASEMISEGNMLNKDATDFLNKYEGMVEEGKADARFFDLLKEFKTLEDRAEKTPDKFTNTKLADEAEGIMSVEDMKYYDKKAEDVDKKLNDLDKRLSDIDTEFTTKGIDASELTRTPDFQEWLGLYMSESGTSRKKALNHPNADIYLGLLGARLKGRDESFYEAVPRKKDGGLMNLGGKEMDLRKGGFVPIGKKERADDVPARLSKNEFVMTADAVRAAGGGSVNEGAKRMYDVMNKLEARA